MADTLYQLYGILAGNTITSNTDITTIYGDVGTNTLNESAAIIYSGQLNIGSISSALTDAQTNYNTFMAMTPTTTISTTNIGGMTFNPGVIQLTNSIIIGGSYPNNKITLDGSGQYVFQINGSLTTDTTSNTVFLNLINDAKASMVYWVVNGSVNIQTINSNSTMFQGSIISQGNITLGTNSTNYGTLAAPNGSITVNANKVTSQVTQVFADTIVNFNFNFFTSLYINMQSTLSDSQAIKINASNINGGIDIDAGLGGIAIDTTNSINMNAAAASTFSTSNGNLSLQASGLTNIDGVNGINIGNDATKITPEIDIGTYNSSKRITIGNLTGSTFVNLNSGTGGINMNTNGAISLNSGAASNFTLASTTNNQDLVVALTGNHASRVVLSSQGTGSDSIYFNTSSGGLTSSISGAINLVSFSTSGAAFNVDTTTNNGGLSLSAGNQGVIVNSYNGGTIAIGTFTPATIYLGTAGPNSITIGNATSTSSLSLHSGSGGITIGNDANAGEIDIGNINSDKTLIIGNNSTNTRLFNRFGTAGFVKHQEAETVLADADATLTISQLLIALMTITPTTSRTLTLPTAANAVAGISGIAINDAIDFSIINLASSTITIVAGTGGTFIGTTTLNLGSALFRMRFTNITSGSEAYKVYRIS